MGAFLSTYDAWFTWPTAQGSVYFIDGDSQDCAVIKQIPPLPQSEQLVACTKVGSQTRGLFNLTIGIIGIKVFPTTTPTIYLVILQRIHGGGRAAAAQ